MRRMRVELTQGAIWYAFFGNFPLIILGILILAFAFPLLWNIFTNPAIQTMYQLFAYMLPLLIVIVIIALIARLLSRPRVATYY